MHLAQHFVEQPHFDPLSSDSKSSSQYSQYLGYVHSCIKLDILIKVSTDNLITSWWFMNLLSNQELDGQKIQEPMTAEEDITLLLTLKQIDSDLLVITLFEYQ